MVASRRKHSVIEADPRQDRALQLISNFDACASIAGSCAVRFTKVPKQVLLFVDDLPADAGLFHQVVIALQLEGFVAKRKASTYQPGARSPDWRKIKRPGWQEGRRWTNR